MSFVTYRGCVNAWECDQWGHQNVRYYLAKASAAQAALCNELGLTPSWLRERGATPMVRRHRMLFRRELHAADPVYIRSGLRAVEGSRLIYWSALSHAETRAESAVFETELAVVDKASATPIELPPHIVEGALKWANPSEYAAPPRIEGPRAPTFTPDNAVLTHRGSIGIAECDESGWTAPEHQVIHFTQAMVHLMASLGLPRETLLRRQIGYAALDHAVEYRAALKPGSRVEMRSGVLEIRPKVLRIFHHVIDADTGGIATALEIALVFFDLAARKSVAMPDEIIERARKLMPR